MTAGQTTCDGNRDASFYEAMVRLASWRAGQPEDGRTPEPEDVRQARETIMLRLSSLREGDVDPWMGRTIKVLVRKSTRYIVYLDDQLDIQWWWTQRLPKESSLSVVQANVMRLSGATAFLLDTDSTLYRWSMLSDVRIPGVAALNGPERRRATLERSRRQAEQIRLLVAESMAMVLNGVDRAECEKVQLMAEQQIIVAKDQACRSVFFWEFFLAVSALLACLVAIQHWGPLILESRMPGDRWYMAAMAGAFGAFLSSVARTRSLGLEPDSGRRGLRMEAFSRALIGAGAGLLVHFGFDAGLIAKGALDPNNAEVNEAMTMFLSMASGWSERILPSLLGKAESLVDGGRPVKK